MAKLKINNHLVIDHGSDWPDFRKWIDGTHNPNNKLSFTWCDEGNSYSLIAKDADFARVVGINKDDSNYCLDFENNFKVNKPLEERVNGALVTSSTYSHFKEAARFQGFLLQASGINTDTILDHKLTDQIYVHGGWFWTQGGAMGDYADFSVVDKDNILGYFGYYGLQVGQDVLELGKYVDHCYLNPDGTDMAHLETPTVAPVASGLYMRVKLHTTTDTPLALGVTYLWFEV
jgi:hypothetical protein